MLTTIMATDTILVIHPALPPRNPRELVALAKKRPGQLAFGSAGSGGILHLALEQLNLQAGSQITHVPYKGAGPAVVAMSSPGR